MTFFRPLTAFLLLLSVALASVTMASGRGQGAGGTEMVICTGTTIKVVMIGTHQIHRQLYALDEDFKKIFKIKADFARWTDRSDEEQNNYACFVHKKVKDDGLAHFTAAAVATVVEQGVRLAGRRDKLTTQFNRIADVIREAIHQAGL